VIAKFDLVRPTTLSAVLDALGDGGVPYVGGTELVAAMQLGLVDAKLLVDLKQVVGLNQITRSPACLHVGASVRHRDVATSPEVISGWPMLASVCTQLGNQRVRATGSVGGNLCFADPRSDITTALFALEATVVLKTVTGERRVPIDEFVLGAMETDLAEGELLTSIEVPTSDCHHIYIRHQPAEYPTVCVAMTQRRSHPGGPTRIVIGAVTERPHVFEADTLEAVALDKQLENVLAELEVMADLNGSEPYKRHLAGVFVRRAAAAMKEVSHA
jgi:carbon-monoxide dehydrogenase medium subunit